MRTLKGHVDLLGLGNMLQLLAVNKSGGVLTVRRDQARQSIYFAPSGIRLLSSTLPRVRRIRSLARKILGKRPVTPEGLRTVLKDEKLLGSMLGHVVLSAEQIRKEELEQALRHQVEEEILDMFVWSQAQFEFKEWSPPRQKSPDPLAELPLEANVTSLLLEAARRADEVRQIRETLTSDRLKLERVARDIYVDQLGEDVIRVDSILPLIKRPKTLRSVLQASIYPEFATMRAVHKLMTLGYLKVHGHPTSPPAPTPASGLPIPS